MRTSVSADGDFAIIDSLLVYDSGGVLVKKMGVESSTFEKKELSLSGLPAGTYTLILWQSAYRKSDGLTAWKVVSEDYLSSVSIPITSAIFRYEWSLGYVTTTVKLNQKSGALEMTPKSLGCIMDVTIENFTDDLGYTRVAMVAAPNRRGVFLSPYFPDNYRWVNDNNYINVPFKVYPQDGGKGKFFTFVTGEDIKMDLRGDKEGDYDTLSTFLHQNVVAGGNYIVYFDMDRSGWQPPFFGPAEKFAAWKAKCDEGLLAFDPYINWGSNISDVKEYMSQRQWSLQIGDELEFNGKLWNSEYKVANSLREQYFFNTEDGQDLRSVGCWNDNPEIPVERAEELVLKQGYVYVGKLQYPGDPGAYKMYYSPDNTTEVVIITIDSDEWVIVYRPYSPELDQYLVEEGDVE